LLTTSIALATYNGSQFIEKQLCSILSQSQFPNQLLISDDSSDDDTCIKVQTILKNSSCNYKILTTTQNIGYSKNFERTLKHCTKDIIFFCDQDDVWFDNKIAVVTAFFQQNSKFMLVIHDIEFCNQSLKPTGKSKLDEIKKLYNIERSYVTGMATSIRREFLEFCLPIPTNVSYDLWIHSCAYYLDTKFILSQSLAYYRRHHTNATHLDHFNYSYRSKLIYFLKIIITEFFRTEIPFRLNLPQLVLERVLSKKDFLRNNLNYNEINFRDLVEKLSYESLIASERSKLKKLSFFTRLYKVPCFYFKGYYSYFSGFSSFLKDLIAP